MWCFCLARSKMKYFLQNNKGNGLAPRQKYCSCSVLTCPADDNRRCLSTPSDFMGII